MPASRSVQRRHYISPGSGITLRDVAGYAWRNRASIGRGIRRAIPSLRGTPVNRRVSISTAGTSRRSSMASSTSSFGGGSKRVGTSISTRAGQVVKGRKKIKLKSRKVMKVPSKLKTQIRQVVDGNKISGNFQDNRIDLLDPGALAGQQNVERLPNRTLTFGGYLFNYDRILHAASRLWNGKAASQSPSAGDAGNFRPQDTVINVTNQYWVFRLRNNSSRCAYIRLIKCQSKNAVQASDALFAWGNAITQEQTVEGNLIGTPPVLVNTMHTEPTDYTQFRAGYKTEIIKITLDPGQGQTIYIPGPKMTYDGKKFYDNATYKVIQKQDIQLLWVSNVDLVGTHTFAGGTGAYGYAPDGVVVGDSAQERVIVESTYQVSMNMPEKVGGVSTAAASLFINQNRVFRRVVDDFQPVTWTGGVEPDSIHRRDDENPVQEIIP